MNPLLQKLQQISQKKERRIIGLMSGTSMDGLDIALCRISGTGYDTNFDLEEFATVAYKDDIRHQLIALVRTPTLDAEQLCVWNTHLAHIHASQVKKIVAEWGVRPQEVDLIASHGQTLHHAPKQKHRMKGMPNATLQIGDGDHLAKQTGVITISDFRQRDTARGFEGAPLAAYGDYLLFGKPDITRVLLNIGGIANLTVLPEGGRKFPPFATDTGPGNTLIDAMTEAHYGGLTYDIDGGLAARGNVHDKLLSCLKGHPFFKQKAPKTTGFEVFHPDWVRECIEKSGFQLQAEDLLATLTRLTTDTIISEIQNVLHENGNAEIFVSGGGANNITMMKQLDDGLSPHRLQTTESLGVGTDAKEAVLFAALANELICGEDTRLHFGKISLPDT